ncbi:hypothetical protein N9858_04275 [Flavobacteriaceae bacterium]|nr:hypothetical protein [Flavobacteriaceae bacterium]
MKKGLLSILASALLVVGCQNYDDQFTSIENQINSLASTVAGLSDVATQISSLSGTVNSLTATVNGLGDEIDTAVADGLADIQEDITAIEAAVADVASSEDVEALQESVDASQSDLDELLANSSVYQNDILINSVATLNVYDNMGSSINIVNGSVTITVSEAMDIEAVQRVVDNILITLEDFTYTSGASTIAEVTFQNLTGTSSLTVEQAGGYDFRNLQSATNIVLGDAYKSTIGVIHFGALNSVTSFATEADANTISFSKATELHLTALPYYAPGSLTLLVDTGSVIDITALDDVDSSGDQDDLALTVSGPSTLTLSNIDDGDITISDVATAVVNGFVGNITVGADVESFTADSVVESLTITDATDLETLNITGVLDADDDDSVGIAIAITSVNSDLENLTVAGAVASLTATAAGKLTTAVISADVDGAITFTNNDDLVTLTLTDSEADSVAITGNDSLVTLTVDTTNSEDDGSLVITNNLDLESLTVTYDEVETLTITGNTALETVDLSGITAAGAAGAPVVNIYSNDLTATSAVDEEDTTATADGAAATDLGEFTTTSGLDTAADYLALVAADADSSAAVFFDTVESYTNEAEAESTDVVFATSLLTALSTAQNATTVLLKVANTADTGDDATTAKRSFLIDLANTTAIDSNGENIVLATQMTAGLSMNAAYNVISGTDAIATAADNAAISIAAVKNASPYADFQLSANSSSVENSYTGNAAAAFSFGVSDTMTLSVDGSSVTITAADVLAITNASLDEATAVRAALIAAWNTEYAGGATPSVASAKLVRWELQELTGGTQTSANFRAVAKDRGSRDIDASMSLTHSQGKTTTDSNIGIVIGNGDGVTESTADNSASGTYLMVTLTADTAGSILSQIGKYGDGNAVAIATAKAVAITNTDFVELTSTYVANTTASNSVISTDIYPNESRLDVIIPEESNTAATSNAVSYTRVGWL